MTDRDLHRRAVSSAPRLTPEEIASRGFAGAFRGVSEHEVRNFLRRVADEVAHARDRERELTERVAALEERLRNPPPPTEQELLDALGEETARVLRSAQEAAEDIRTRAEERAQLLVREAQEESQRLRESADEYSSGRTREADETAEARVRGAEAHAAELREGAERDAAETRERAGRDVEAELEAARATGREMIAEARAVRERALTDLARRRTLLQAQIDALRAGRERLVDSYRVVKRTLAEATEALADVEAPAPGTEPAEPRAEPAERAAGGVEGAEVPPTRPPAGDLEALFAKLRAAAPQPGTAADHPERSTPVPEPEPIPRGETGDGALLAARDGVLAPIQAALARRAKRALQDEQNVLLDVVRTQKGRVSAAKVLPGLDAQSQTWAEVLRSSVDAAYGAARGSADTANGAAAAPDELLDELTAMVVTPLRERLVATVGDATEASAPDDVSQRIGARYREWKLQMLDGALGDVLAAAWARGVFDRAPEGALLRWIPAESGRCPDADDNALEPTRRGQPFPTGQACPPAHPGCRCLLAVSDDAGSPPGRASVATAPA